MDEIQIKKEIEELKREVQSLKTGRITDINPESINRNVFRQNLSRDIMDIVWDQYFYDFQWLGTVTAVGSDSNADTMTVPGIFSSGTSGSGTLTISSDHITLSTGTTSSSATAIFKRPDIQNILSFNKEQRFRSAFEITSTSSQDGYVIIGKESSNTYYGFHIDDGALKGICYDGTSSTEVTLISSLSTNTTYEVEARLYPGTKVEFFVAEEGGSPDTLLPRGAVSSNLPSGSNDNLYQLEIQNTAAADKQLKVSFVEYIQLR